MLRRAQLLWTLTVRFAGIGLLYVVSIVLAKKLGVEGYGQFTATLSIVTIAATFSSLGLPTLATREISREFTFERQAQFISSVLAGALLGLLPVLFLLSLGVGQGPEYLFEALVIFPVISLVYLRQGVALPMLGASRAIVTEQVVLPSLFLVFVWVSEAGEILSVSLALYCYAVAALLSLFMGLLAFKKTETFRLLPRYMSKPLTWKNEFGVWPTIRSAAPFLLTQLPRVLLANADILIVATLIGSSEAGLYAFASRLAALVALPLTIVNLSYSPVFVRLYQENNKKKLAEMAHQAAGYCLLGSWIIFFAVVFGFDWVVKLTGDDFRESYLLVLVLGVGQIVNSMFGPNGTILQMINLEMDVMRVVWIQSTLLLILCSIAAGYGSVFGVAISAASAVVIGNLMNTYNLWRRGGFLLYPSLSLAKVKRK